MKSLIKVAGLLAFMAVGISAKADNPIGVAGTFDHTTKLNVSYDLTQKHVGPVTVNAGAYLGQRSTNNWDRFTVGPQLNIAFRRLFSGVNYDWASKRSEFVIGVKF